MSLVTLNVVPVALPLLLPLLLLVAMHWSAQLLARQSSRLVGRRIHLYLFGLLGTVVHEGSHVLACVLFRHRVDRVTWFDPQATNGALGSVEHSYDPTSVYQRVGTLAIGIAPLLVGATVILFAAQRLLDISLSVVEWENMPTINVPLSRWVLFAYVCLSVGGSMHLSASDVRGTWRGVVSLAVGSAIVTMAAVLLWWVLQHAAPTVWDSTVVPRLQLALHWLTRTSASLSIAMLLAVAINTVFALLLMLLLMLLRLLPRRSR